MRIILSTLLVALATSCSPAGRLAHSPPLAPAADLPVSAVTVYTSGATHVEHSGAVAGAGSLELRVKASQLPGVLRSMVINNGQGGPAPAIRTPEPTTRPYDSRRVDLSENPTLVELLEQLRGSRVRLSAGGETLDATLVSLEQRDMPGGNRRLKIWHVNLLSDGALRTVPLDAVLRVELDDPRAQKGLDRALEALRQSGEQERKSIAIDLPGGAARTVRLGYTLEAQPWKMSYRLTLGSKPSLQAWATVPNETDDDWNNVQLTLMSERPIVLGDKSSTDAKAVERAVKAAGAPAGESLRRPRPIPSREAIDGQGGAGDPEFLRRWSGVRPPDAPLLNASEAFQHTVRNVTIPRRSATAVPVCDDAVSAERVSVYNEGLSRKSPLHGALIGNPTAHYLLQGPLAVFEDGRYVGDAAIDNLSPGRKCLVSWGIDLPLLVDASDAPHTTAMEGARISAGELLLSRRHTYIKHYAAENEDQKDRTLIIEHPIRRGWRLIEPAEPMEVTETLYRFRLSVRSGQRVILAVKEQTTQVEAVDLLSADAETFLAMTRESAIASPVREALTKAAALRTKADEQQKQLQQTRAEISRQTREQARLRENIKAAPAEGDLAKRLVEKLSRCEDQIEALSKSLEQTQQSMEAANKDLQSYLQALTVGE